MIVVIRGKVDKHLVDWASFIKSDVLLTGVALERRVFDGVDGVEVLWHSDTGSRGTFGSLKQWRQILEGDQT